MSGKGYCTYINFMDLSGVVLLHNFPAEHRAWSKTAEGDR
ncbi:6039_t:CDS:2 [Paraglomus occultum]|uniref:6039_t:CDS:1 n=1 Tax=Paraglomus occultum TaxID=144539 RepID=A0A9N9BUC0_9GLOM|nr:6039_t:CDS:2 [Paraglomus occultum]